MGKSTPQAPVPDPRTVAETDAYFNRIDQFTPFGTLQFRGPARNQAFLHLDPQDQLNLDLRRASDEGLLRQGLARQGNLDNALPDIPFSLGTDISEFDTRIDRDFSDFDRDRFERSIFERGQGLLNTQFDRQEDRLRQDLANRGLLSTDPELGEAAQTELGLFNEARDEAFQDLALDAVARGGAEQRADLASQFALESGLAADERTAFQTALANELQGVNLLETARAREFNELASLLGLQQTQAAPLTSFFGPAQADVGGAFGLFNQANMFNAGQRGARNQGVLGGLFDLGSAFLGTDAFSGLLGFGGS